MSKGKTPQLCKMRVVSSSGRWSAGGAAGPWGRRGERDKETQWDVLRGFAGALGEGWGSLKVGLE